MQFRKTANKKVVDLGFLKGYTRKSQVLFKILKPFWVPYLEKSFIYVNHTLCGEKKLAQPLHPPLKNLYFTGMHFVHDV
ncbi:hypothetical protein MHBO_005123 [Bonamia ostreae]|uniref:Uncharacterized protein n=1 Tax=Bonamia ostreae TaxID=126728 RepID=A0ABV2AV50_9EUKA